MQSIKSLASPACTISLASFKGSDAILAFAGVRSAAHLIAASLPGASLSKQNITWSNNSNHSNYSTNLEEVEKSEEYHNFKEPINNLIQNLTHNPIT